MKKYKSNLPAQTSLVWIVIMCCIMFFLSNRKMNGDDSFFDEDGGGNTFTFQVVSLKFGIHVDVVLNEWDSDIEKIDSHSFRRLNVPGLGVSGSVGRPELPVWRRLIEVPLNAAGVKATVTSMSAEPALVDGKSTGEPLYPVQPPVEKVPGAKPAPLVWDRAYYARTGKTDAVPVEVSHFGIQRGRNLYLVSVYPFEYTPASSALTVRTALSFDVSWSCESSVPQWRASRYRSLLLEQPLAPVLLNEEGTKDGFAGYPAGLLIIAAPSFFNDPNLADYVAWKNQRGLHTTLVSTAETGATATAIRDYIQNAYDTWDIPPSFLLLVGDTDTIPHWTGGGSDSPPTDLNYALLDGTEWNTPDIWCGRFSVRTAAELAHAVHKTLNYEHRLWSTAPGWEKNASFMAGQDNYAITEGTHNAVITSYFNPAGFTSEKIYMVSYGGTTQQIRNAANDGRSFLVYSGHGGETVWADGPYFSQSDVTSLNNDVFPMVFGFACVTGCYTITECFGETWLRHEAGGLAYWGSSVNSFWDEDDILERKVFNGFWDQGLTWIGAMLEYGKTNLYLYYGNTTNVRRYFEMYNLMGDPSVELVTEVIQDLSLSHAPVLQAGVSSFSVYGAPDGAVAAITQDGRIHGVTVSSGGEAAMSFTPPLISGSALLTITCRNYRSLEVALPVAAGSEGSLFLDASRYACEDTVVVRVSDTDLNTDPGTAQTVMVTVISTSEPSGMPVTLTESGPDTSFFSGNVALSATGIPGSLAVADGDTITATYVDADDGAGGLDVPVTADAVIDCAPTGINNVNILNIQATEASVTFDTDEPATGVVRYGTACDALTFDVTEAGLKTSHSIALSGLLPDSAYFLSIEAADAVGNSAVNDNNGSCYGFATLEQTDYFTEVFDASDNDVSNQTLFFTPDGSMNFYQACREPATSFSSDPAGGIAYSLADDGYAAVTLSGGRQVSLYGVSYTTFYIGSNGYITFGTAETEYQESVGAHFALPHISGLFDDLNPASAGTVSSREFADHVAITFQDVPEYGGYLGNSFQIEMYYEGGPDAGLITITHLGMASTDGLVGISQGNGMPVDFVESDLSAYTGCLGEGEGEGENIPIPADLNMDWRVGISEAIAYLTGWQQGVNPINYAIRAAYIWKNGEQYVYDPQTAPPLCWVVEE